MFSGEKAAPGAEHSRRRGRRRGACPLLVLSILVQGCSESWPELPEDLRADAIVVLGNRPPTDEHGRVMPETERRVQRGVEVYNDGLAPLVVMTGGRAPRGDIEAEVMKNFAVELGVPEDAIRLETESRNTIENARFTKQLLSGDGGAERRPQVILVTSPYHLGRAEHLFDCAGFDVEPTAAAAPPNFLRRIGFRVYEVMVSVYYGFIDQCGRARGE